MKRVPENVYFDQWPYITTIIQSMQSDYSNRTSAGQIIAQPLPRLIFILSDNYRSSCHYTAHGL